MMEPERIMELDCRSFEWNSIGDAKEKVIMSDGTNIDLDLIETGLLTDVSGNAKHGVICNIAPCDINPGKGIVLSHADPTTGDQITGQLACVRLAQMQFVGEGMSVSYFLTYSRSPTENATLFSMRSATGSFFVLKHCLPANKLLFQIAPGGEHGYERRASIRSRTKFRAGTNYHVCGVVTNDGQQKLFVNGVLEAHGKGISMLSDAGVAMAGTWEEGWVGRDITLSGSAPLNGAFKNLQVYDGELHGGRIGLMSHQLQVDSLSLLVGGSVPSANSASASGMRLTKRGARQSPISTAAVGEKSRGLTNKHSPLRRASREALRIFTGGGNRKSKPRGTNVIESQRREGGHGGSRRDGGDHIDGRGADGEVRGNGGSPRHDIDGSGVDHKQIHGGMMPHSVKSTAPGIDDDIKKQIISIEPIANNRSGSIKERLRELTELREEGLISESDFDAKKQSLLNEL